MLVVAIIGILAAVALPAYQDYNVRARVAEGFELATAVEKSVSEYRDRWGVLPPDNAAAGLPAADAMRGTWVASIEVIDGSIAVKFVPRLASEFKDETPTLLLRPAINPDWPTAALVWVCHDRAPPPGFTLRPAPQNMKLLPGKFLPSPCKR